MVFAPADGGIWALWLACLAGWGRGGGGGRPGPHKLPVYSWAWLASPPPPRAWLFLHGNKSFSVLEPGWCARLGRRTHCKQQVLGPDPEARPRFQRRRGAPQSCFVTAPARRGRGEGGAVGSGSGSGACARRCLLPRLPLALAGRPLPAGEVPGRQAGRSWPKAEAEEVGWSREAGPGGGCWSPAA